MSENEFEDMVDELSRDVDGMLRGEQVGSDEITRIYLSLGPRKMIKVLKELERSERIRRESIRAHSERKILDCKIAAQEIESFENTLKYGGC